VGHRERRVDGCYTKHCVRLRSEIRLDRTAELSPHRDRSFAAKVYAFNAGFERVKNLEYEVIGNLDSDISFEPDYLEFLMNKSKKTQILESREPYFTKKVIAPQRTALRGRTMLLVVASFSTPLFPGYRRIHPQQRGGHRLDCRN